MLTAEHLRSLLHSNWLRSLLFYPVLKYQKQQQGMTEFISAYSFRRIRACHGGQVWWQEQEAEGSPLQPHMFSRENWKWDEATNSPSLPSVTYFLKQGYAIFPNSAPNQCCSNTRACGCHSHQYHHTDLCVLNCSFLIKCFLERNYGHTDKHAKACVMNFVSFLYVITYNYILSSLILAPKFT